MNVRENAIYYIKKNIFIVLVLIGLCPILAISYAKFTINSESYRSNEMYISKLLYSIKIDDENTYTLDVEPGETEHTIEITSLSGISTNYKLAYLNNDKLEIRYASDYMDASFGGIIMTRTISLTIKNTSNEKQTLSLMVFGGYSFNDLSDVKALDTYTEIDTNYLHYDYETTALYVDNTRVDELDSSKNYTLVNYTCTNDAIASYDALNRQILIKSDNQTKCSLYFEENTYFTLHLINNYQALGLTKIEQTATGNQNYNTIEYRYQGANPNNYITFNDEVGKWRIIGIFEVETLNSDGTYTKEHKAKLIRNSISSNLAWNYCVASDTMVNNNSDDKNGTCDRNTKAPGDPKKNKNVNDWTIADLQEDLNSGEFYNNERTHLSSGLTDASKELISTTKWYLGNANINSNVVDIYKAERGSKVKSGNQTIWNGKVALMYPSDYMYASENCTSISGSSFSTCTSDNWLDNGYNTHSKYWTLNSPISNTTLALVEKHIKAKFMEDVEPDDNFYSPAIIIVDNKNISYNKIRSATVAGACFDTEIEIRPVVYLSSSVEYESGDGSSSNPFVVK